MADIIPRWEWRSFGASFGAAEARIRALGAQQERASEETYLPCRTSNDNTKIRFDLLDVKRLQAVDEHGLQQWFPVMKSGFPLPAAQADLVRRAWSLPAVAADLAVFSYEALLATARRLPGVAVVPVAKQRATWLWQGAVVELSDLTIARVPTRTVCVEHENPTLVWRLVTELGLAGLPNQSYLAAIKRQLDWE